MVEIRSPEDPSAEGRVEVVDARSDVFALADTVAPAVGLVAKVAVGAVVFGAATLLLWVMRGRPDGPEATVLAHVRSRFS